MNNKQATTGVQRNGLLCHSNFPMKKNLKIIIVLKKLKIIKLYIFEEVSYFPVKNKYISRLILEMSKEIFRKEKLQLWEKYMKRMTFTIK